SRSCRSWPEWLPHRKKKRTKEGASQPRPKRGRAQKRRRRLRPKLKRSHRRKRVASYNSGLRLTEPGATKPHGASLRWHFRMGLSDMEARLLSGKTCAEKISKFLRIEIETVEVNYTFRQLVKETTVQNWIAE